MYSNRIKFVSGSSETPPPIFSSTNKMMITLWVRVASQHRGFKIKFDSEEKSICTGDLNQNEGTIQPPVFQNMSSYYCDYIREVKPIGDTLATGTLALSFTEARIGKKISPNCRYASTVVNLIRSSGRSENEKYLYRLCGNETQTLKVLSPFPDLIMEVKEGIFFGPMNFVLNYKAHNCGGILKSGLSQIIKAPAISKTNYGEVDCSWYVEYEEGLSIGLKINVSFTLPYENEFIHIYNGPTQMSPLIGDYGKNSPMTAPTSIIYSQTNKVLLSKYSIFMQFI